MRWVVEVSSIGKTDLQKFVVEAESWQRALQGARAQRGEEGPMSGFSIELLEEGYRAVDPVARVRFVVKRAPDDTPITAPLAKDSGRAGVAPSPPSPSSGSGQVKSPISFPPKPSSTSKPSVPPKADPSSPPAKHASAPPPAAVTVPVGSALAGLPAVKVLSTREQDPTEASPLTYREYSFAVPKGTPEDVAVEVLRGQLKIIDAHLATVKVGKLVNLAAFDVEFDGKPPVPPLATLTWKDWKGDPVLAYPRRGGDAKQVKPPTGISSVPPSGALFPPPSPPSLLPTRPPPPAGASQQPTAPPAAPAITGQPPANGPFKVTPSSRPPPPATTAATVVPPQAPVPQAAVPPASAPVAPPPAPSAPPVVAPPVAVPPVAAPEPAPPPAVAPAPSPVPAAAAPAPSPPPVRSPEIDINVINPVFPAPPPTGVSGSMAPGSAPPPIARRSSSPDGMVRTPSGRFVRGRTTGDELITALFESMHDLHFLRDALDGGQFCLALATEVLPARAALIHFFDVEKREWVVACTRGKEAGKLLSVRTNLDDELLRDAARKRRAVVTSDATTAATAERYQTIGGGRSLIIAPIMQAGRALGAIEIINPLDGMPFTEDEGNAMTYIAEQYAEYLGSRGMVLDPARIQAAANPR